MVNFGFHREPSKVTDGRTLNAPNGCVQGSPNGTDRVPKVPDGWIGNRWYPSVCKLGAIFLPISPHLLRCGKLGGLDLSKFQHGVVGILEVNKDGINT